MEGTLYRRRRQNGLLKKLLKKAVGSRRRTLVLVLSFLALIYLLFDNKGILKRVSLEIQKREMTQKIQTTQAETKELQARLQALEGEKKTIEKLAREKYGMAREKETVYRMRKD